jgi:hypothetical protein
MTHCYESSEGGSQASKRDAGADLCGEGDADGGAGAEEIAEAAGRDAQLFGLVTGTAQAGVGQSAVTFDELFTGSALSSVTKFAPGLLRLNILKNSRKGVTDHRS